MRIVSFLPAATEMVCALGLEDQLVGVTHECDFPEAVRRKPVVVRPAVDTRRLAPAAIDGVISARLREGGPLFDVDASLLAGLRPDLILTQDLCDVCAPSKPQAFRAIEDLPKRPEILYLTPHGLNDIWENLRAIGKATDRLAEAELLIRAREIRLERLRRLNGPLRRPKVLFMEWVDPVFNGGHWVPELIEAAGGCDLLARPGKDSVRLSWGDVREYQPEILVISPCGYGTEAAARQAENLFNKEGWAELPAVRERRVYAVDANAYFARPGPRIIDGAELLAHLFHPQVFAWSGSAGAFKTLLGEAGGKCINRSENARVDNPAP